MLAKIREKTQGIIATLILTFLAIPFILWGIGSYFEGNSSIAVAKVNGTEITQQTYRQRLEEFSGLDPRRSENQAIKELIVDTLVDQTLLVSNAEDEGYRLSDSQLLKLIHDVPYFQQDGRFDSVKYEALLRQQGMRPADFETRLRRDQVTTQIQRGLSESAFVTEADVAAALRLMKQERRISYALISPEQFISKVSVSAPEIQEYYQTNQESFRTAEAVRIEYVTLKADAIKQQAQPTEEEIRQAYNADIARFTTPEKRTVSHILINAVQGTDETTDKAARAKAEDLLKQIRAGKNFAALAKEHSDDKESGAKGGDLGQMLRGSLPPELEAAVTNLKPGEVTTAPVRTRFGYHIAKLTAYQPEQRQSFESVKKELTEQLSRRKGEEKYYELTERFRNLVYEHTEGLAPVAKELGLTVQTSEWFTRQGGHAITANPKVIAAAFEPDVLSRQRNSDTVEIDPETLLALRVIEHRPSVVRPLEEVRATIERTLKEQRAREQAQAAAAEWTKKIEAGGKLAEVARSAGVSVQAAKTITREQAPGVDRRVAEAVFSAPRPAEKPVVGQVDLGKQGYAVYLLEAVKDVDVAAVDAESKNRLRAQLAQRRGADFYNSYRAGLRKTADIKVNKDQL